MRLWQLATWSILKISLRRQSSTLGIDILLSLKGEDSYGAGCWSGLFGGFLPQPPYFSGGQRRGLTFGLSTHRSFGREDDRTNQREKNAATVTFGYIPRWLDAAALYPRPERRGFTALRGVSPCFEAQTRKWSKPPAKHFDPNGRM